MRGKGNGGEYFYFFCRGRQKHVCDLPYLSVAKIEAAVGDATSRRYASATRSVPASAASSTKRSVRTRQHEQPQKALGARLDELDTREDGYLDLIGDPDWPRAKVKAKLARIEEEAPGDSVPVGRHLDHDQGHLRQAARRRRGHRRP
jgi:hypothetical protein